MTDALLLAIRSFFKYKTPGSNILGCFFSALLLMVVFFWSTKAAIYILAYSRLVAIAVRMNIRSKRSYCATMNQKDSPFVLGQFLHRVKLLEMKVGEGTEEKDTLFLPHLITTVILKAEVRESDCTGSTKTGPQHLWGPYCSSSPPPLEGSYYYSLYSMIYCYSLSHLK